MSTPPFRFITIPASHFCEKARWALDLAQVSYTEEKHVPMFHYASTFWNSRSKTVPVLLVPNGPVLSDSHDILLYLHQHFPSAASLYPSDAAQRAEVERLEMYFGAKLGVFARVVAYEHLFPHKDLFLAIMADKQGITGFQRMALPFVFPVLRAMMKKGMRITPENAAKCQEKVLAIFKEVEDILVVKDGDNVPADLTYIDAESGKKCRKYLVGSALSAADITFCSLAAILVNPKNYGAHLFDEGTLPSSFPVSVFRDTIAGRFILRIYENDRKLTSRL
eukprot:GILI01013716.1.p1 GENE.GILI01013716.1~~GILI01013716.1.p1  ORF type:complete len:302 (-),score=67.29 GILI01013716.1:168-1004(-)